MFYKELDMININTFDNKLIGLIKIVNAANRDLEDSGAYFRNMHVMNRLKEIGVTNTDQSVISRMFARNSFVFNTYSRSADTMKFQILEDSSYSYHVRFFRRDKRVLKKKDLDEYQYLDHSFAKKLVSYDFLEDGEENDTMFKIKSGKLLAVYCLCRLFNIKYESDAQYAVKQPIINETVSELVEDNTTVQCLKKKKINRTAVIL